MRRTTTDLPSLHSNMFLLILKECVEKIVITDFTFQYVSINTAKTHVDAAAKTFFTFQYVSINTERS